MLKPAIISVALLAATAAQAGYYDHLNPPPPTESEMLQRQLYEQRQEIEELRRAQPRCVQRALPNGQLYSYCE